jgi:hypothetical protein
MTESKKEIIMETLWRPKSPRLLADAQKKAKLLKDSEYEIAHRNLSADFQKGKLTQAEFEAAHTKQWKDYEDWAKLSGLYEEVTPEQQLAEVETRLTEEMNEANSIRQALGLSPLQLTEKVIGVV